MNNVFVNRLLNMRKIRFLGLDMDHTLIRYHTKAFEKLVYEGAQRKLVEEKGYPKCIQSLKFDFDRAIRGLVIDRQRGNILKLSRHGAIRNSFHGTKPIGFQEQKTMYRSHYVDLRDDDYFVVDTSFSIAFCCLYGQVVDVKDQQPDDVVGYSQIAQDISDAVDELHRDGGIKPIVADNLEQYIIREPEVIQGLQRFKVHGKKIFILTNSDFHYTKVLLDYAVNPYLSAGETWETFFEFVITLAKKPSFFYDQQPYLQIDVKTSELSPLEAGLRPGIYQGGSAKKLASDLKLEGDDILYIGDHIYGDLIRLKKDCNWRTALVIDELEQEIQGLIQSQSLTDNIRQMMDEKAPIEQQLVDLNTLSIEEKSHQYDDEIQTLYKQVAEIDEKISACIEKQQSYFNACWGPVFRSGAEESYFAQQVNRFACIYMSKLADLLSQSPRNYYRAHWRPMAHELTHKMVCQVHNDASNMKSF